MSRRAANIISAQVIQKPDSVLGLANRLVTAGYLQAALSNGTIRGDLDFKDVTSVNLDEYCGLPASHDQSYRYFMDTNFFNH